MRIETLLNLDNGKATVTLSDAKGGMLTATFASPSTATEATYAVAEAMAWWTSCPNPQETIRGGVELINVDPARHREVAGLDRGERIAAARAVLSEFPAGRVDVIRLVH